MSAAGAATEAEAATGTFAAAATAAAGAAIIAAASATIGTMAGSAMRSWGAIGPRGAFVRGGNLFNLRSRGFRRSSAAAARPPVAAYSAAQATARVPAGAPTATARAVLGRPGASRFLSWCWPAHSIWASRQPAALPWPTCVESDCNPGSVRSAVLSTTAVPPASRRREKRFGASREQDRRAWQASIERARIMSTDWNCRWQSYRTRRRRYFRQSLRFEKGLRSLPATPSRL